MVLTSRELLLLMVNKNFPKNRWKKFIARWNGSGYEASDGEVDFLIATFSAGEINLWCCGNAHDR
jgi:hypothetical protein